MPRDGSSSVRAVVRVRPLLSQESERDEQVSCEVPDGHSILIQGSSGSSKWRQYTFDACLPPDRSQKQVFQESGVTNLLDAALTGYSSTVIAYGQTGSGKTYTMMGRLGAMDSNGKGQDGSKEEGLITRSAKCLFKRIHGGSAMPDTKYSVSVSFTEIFNAPGAVNECICDLLNPSAGNLQVRHNKKHGFFVADLSVVDCHSAADVRAVLDAGLQNRRVAAHALNKDSSRSHAMFTLYIDAESVAAADSNEVSAPGSTAKRYGKITFVDLAGSERLKESAAEGHTRKETQAINKSLFILGQVISQLASGKAEQHVPYRNSKLTQLLQESFGGEALCLMITCISPGASFVEESMNSLKYATKAMHITARSRPVVRMDEQQRLVHDLRNENAALRQELVCYRAKFGELSMQDMQNLQDGGIACADPVAEEMLHVGIEADGDRTPATPLSPTGRPDRCRSSRYVGVEADGDRTPATPLSPAGRPDRRRSSRQTSRQTSKEARSPEIGCQRSVPSSPVINGRGSSEPPRAVRPPPPVLVPQPPAPNRAASEGPKKGGSYAMAEAKKRRVHADFHHHPPRRKPHQVAKGAMGGLPPLPRSQVSSRQSLDEMPESPLLRQVSQRSDPGSLVPEVCANVPSRKRSSVSAKSGTSSKEAALGPLRRGSGIVDIQWPVQHRGADQGTASHGQHSVQSPASSSTAPATVVRGDGSSADAPAVPVITAPPSSKGKKDLRMQAAVPDAARLSQIRGLDESHWSEWQFEFSGAHRERPDGGDIRPASGSSSYHSRLPSRCSSYRDSSGSSVTSSCETSPRENLGGSSMPEMMHQAPTTASGTPPEENHKYQHLSLVELNSQLSSMQTATSALLSAPTPDS